MKTFLITLITFFAFCLAGCGVETATTAATVGQMKVEEAKHAQQQLEQAQKQIEEINEMATQRIEEMERSATAPASTEP